MPFSLGTFFTDVANSTTFNSVVNNPIYSALIITLLILVIIYFMYRDAYDDSEGSFWTTFIRSGIYILLVNLAMVYLHYNNQEREYEKRSQERVVTQLVEGTTKTTGAGMPANETVIMPRTVGRGETEATGVGTGAGAGANGSGMSISVNNPAGSPLNLSITAGGAGEQRGDNVELEEKPATLEAFNRRGALPM